MEEYKIFIKNQYYSMKEFDMNILLPFFDDSTMFVAIKTYKLISDMKYYNNINIFFVHILQDKLSYRQLSIMEETYFVIECKLKEFYDAKFLSNFDAVLYSRLPKGIFSFKKIMNKEKYFISKRPYFISMVSGIDFTPHIGIKNRKNADCLCITDDEIVDKYRYLISERQDILKFHPFFCINKLIFKSMKKKDIQNIFFFAQDIIPEKLNARIYIIQILIELAQKYPDKNIFFKL